MFHSGDSDSTGVIAAACYGAMYGFSGVPDCNHKVSDISVSCAIQIPCLCKCENKGADQLRDNHAADFFAT